MSNPGTNTTTSNNQPPQQFLDAYQHTYDQAKTTAGTPYTPYSGQMVAGMSPDQQSGITAVQNAQGAATPYINSAAQYIDQATQPIWDQVQHFSPGAVSQYQSPYTKSVVDATQAEFNNQNQQQQQGVIGNAISSGAWGGDRAGVAQGITAGQQALAQAPVIAGLNNAGYTQALNEFNTQQGSQLGATQANAWLNSQAGAAMGNLGQEALGTSLTGANALLGTGGLEQTQAQAELNVPYQQYTAQQAYPFQSTGWLANIAEGLGGASGGISSTTSPGPSVASQIGGGALAGVGILGQTGAYGSNGNPGWLSGLFGGSGGDIAGGAVGSGYYNRGGPIHRAPGGDIPNLSIAVVPGSVGLGASPLSHGPMDILKNYGDTSTTTQTGGDSGIGSILKAAGTIAAGIYGGPAGGLAANALSSQVHFSEGGGIMPFPIHRARAPGTGRGIVANDDWHLEPVQHRATGGGADMPTLGSSFFMLPSRHGGPSVPFMLSPSVNNIGGTQVGGGGSTTSGTGPASPIQAYFDKQNAGRSFTKPPGPVIPAAPPPAPAPALDGSTPNAGWDPTTPSMSPDQGGGQGGGNARGGIIARRDEGGDVPDDDGAPVLDPTLRSGLTDLARLPTDLSGSAHIHRNESSGSMASGIIGDAGEAAGPMQVHAGALADVNKTYGTHYTSQDIIAHPEIGRAVGNAYYEILKHQFGGDERLATAAYQAGPGAMRAAMENGTGIGGLSPHTQDYVARAGFGAGQSPASAAPPADEDQYSFAMRSRPAGAGIMPSDAPVDTPAAPSPWRMLTNVGLGIMGGTSPQAGVNIGKGALTGIAQTDKENQTEAAQAMTREQQRSTNMFRTAQLTLDQAKLKQTGDLTQQQRDIENARLKEQSRYHDLIADQGHYTASPVTVPDPDDPSKNISGLTRFDTKKGTADFIRTDATPNKGGAGGITLTPEAVQSLAARALNGDYSWTTGLSRSPGAMTSVNNEIDKQMRSAGKTPDEVGQAKQRFAAATKAVSAFDTGSQGNATRSLNVAVAHLGSLEELTPALQNGDTQVINRISNWWKEQTGSPAPTSFNAVRDIAADEIVKAALGAGMSGAVFDREEIRHRLSTAASPQQVAGVIQEYKNLMGGQMRGLQQQYESSTGLHDFRNKLFPETLAALDRVSSGSSASHSSGPTSPSTPAAPPTAVPPAAIQYLKTNPGAAAQFDAKYGAGASRRYLGGQ